MFETTMNLRISNLFQKLRYILDLSYFVCFSYKNITDKLKREWYNFQIGTNEFLTEIFGEDEEEDNEISNKIDDDDET